MWFPLGDIGTSSPDQFDALVLLHHAGNDHRLDLGDGEARAAALCCLCNPGGGGFIA